VLKSESAVVDLDLISYLKAIPDARLRRGVRIPAWYLLLVAVLGILSRCQSLRDLERFAIRHHGVLTEALGLELRRPPSDSAFRYFFRQLDVAALSAAIRDWTIAQIPGGAADLDQLVCDGKTLRGSIEPTAGGGSAYGLRPTTSTLPRLRCIWLPWGWPSATQKLRATARPATPPARTTSGRCSSPRLLRSSKSFSESWISRAF
jgi:hypothetical protein